MSLYRVNSAAGSKEGLNGLLNGASLNGHGHVNGNGRHHRKDSGDHSSTPNGRGSAECRVEDDPNGTADGSAERPLLSSSSSFSSTSSPSSLLSPARPLHYGTRVLLVFLALVVASLAFVAFNGLDTATTYTSLTTSLIVPTPSPFHPVDFHSPPTPSALHPPSLPHIPPSPPPPPTITKPPTTTLPTYALPPPPVPLRSPNAIPAPLVTAYFWCQPLVDGVQQMEFFYLHIPLLPWHDPIITRAHVVMFEAEVDMQRGQVNLLLWDRPQNLDLNNNGELIVVNNPVWYAHLQTLAYLAQQAERGELRCHILQEGQLYRNLTDPLNPHLTWTRPHITQVEHDQWNWLACDFDLALGPPIGIQLLHRVPSGDWVVLERAICPYQLPRTFATGLIKGLYNDAANHLHFIWDFIGYGLRLGIDFFYVIDQTKDQRLRAPFQPLIDRGLVQYLYWPDADGIKVQFAQTAIHHLWSTKHSTYAYAADMDEYIALPNEPFYKRTCLFDGCASPLQSLLTSERYSRYVGLELYAVIMPMWPVPADLRALHPEDERRWLHNESWHRQLAYSGRRADPAYFPHQARAIYHSTLPPWENDRKTIYLVNNVTLARTHDVYPIRGRRDILTAHTAPHFFDDIHVMHYRHIFSVRNLQLEHDNEEHFWEHAKRETLISDIVLDIPYPTPIEDFLDTYPRE